MIVQSQPDYYAVSVDKSQPIIQITELPIIGWCISEDQYGMADNKTPCAITICGTHPGEYIVHPTGIYTEVATGMQYKDKFWFVQCLQAVLDEERRGK